MTAMQSSSWSRIARRVRVPFGFVIAAIFLMQIYVHPPTARSLLWSLLLVVPGGALRAYASGYVRKNAELAVTGPYAYTRNPLYLGSMLMAVGFAAAGRSLMIAALLVLMFVAIYLPVIFAEEAFLRVAFPDFEAYERRVPRLLPRMTPAFPGVSSQTGGGFSGALYVQHREYNSALGAIAIYAALVGRLWFSGRTS